MSNAGSDQGFKSFLEAMAECSDPDIIDRLIESVPDLNSKDEFKEILLFMASSNENPDVIERLAKHGANVNAQGR